MKTVSSLLLMSMFLGINAHACKYSDARDAHSASRAQVVKTAAALTGTTSAPAKKSVVTSSKTAS